MGRTSFRHFWLRIAYSNRVVAVSLAMVWVLRRVASLDDFEVAGRGLGGRQVDEAQGERAVKHTNKYGTVIGIPESTGSPSRSNGRCAEDEKWL
jgi:hypothetical protein